ncbi:hypothetical protein D2N39_11600 [Gemmobacter lutimaris]|uniref:Uncharacterized protein n=1 Tax=Gemmobacter lutimaris TaxID=2306023 RepID=A0A398BN01_9RHOB|nr:hypothetical protein [Gemmobacter lutimaris]RID91875.1 hypothetical protein D2N39_11600 [Gemmobacter lutimaris]
MSVERYSDTVALVCDACGVTTPRRDADEFQDLVDEAKADGWRVTRRDGVWQHHCDACDEETSALDQARRKFGLR